MDTLNAILPILENSGSASGGPYGLLGGFAHASATYAAPVKYVIFMYNTNVAAKGPMHFLVCTSSVSYYTGGYNTYHTATISGKSVNHSTRETSSGQGSIYNTSSGLVFGG